MFWFLVSGFWFLIELKGFLFTVNRKPESTATSAYLSNAPRPAGRNRLQAV
jgi:hypothetical protein